MAAIFPDFVSFQDDCLATFSTGATPVNAGDYILFSDLAAVLLANGYEWTTLYQRLLTPYATTLDAQRAFFWTSGDPTIEADRFTLAGANPTTFGVRAYSQLEIVRQTERAATIRLRNPQTAPGFISNVPAKGSILAIGAALSATCDLKALLSPVYPNVQDIVTAFGNQCVTWGVGFGMVPNLQLLAVNVPGGWDATYTLQPNIGAAEYSYLTIDMGWSGAR